jgi:hypothetical protein
LTGLAVKVAVLPEQIFVLPVLMLTEGVTEEEITMGYKDVLP